MKKFTLFLVAFFLFTCSIFPCKTVKAKGATTYLRVIDDCTPFYQTQGDEHALFLLPYTYYVKVLDENANFYHVEVGDGVNLPAIDGFVPKDKLFSDGLQVSSPYLNFKITTLSTAVLYEDSSLSIPLQYLFKDRQLYYYGISLLEQETAFFVSYNDRLGYVKEQNVLPFSIPNHPNPLTFLPEDPLDEPKDQTENNDVWSLRFTIIACLLFAGIIGLIIAIGKKKEGKISTSEYYDENEYG